MSSPEPAAQQLVSETQSETSAYGASSLEPALRAHAIPASHEHAARNVAPERYAQRNRARFSRAFASPDFPTVRPNYWAAKRLLDIAVTSLALLALLPVFLIIAIAVSLDSPGSALFKQVRVGKGGRFFWCYKFRSMRAGAEEMQVVLAGKNELDGPVFKIKEDPRITRAGKFLRRTSLDELPQLVNVLIGDMSLVGPRPPLPSEVDKYTVYQRGRLAVVPGITCIWQVSGRNNIGFNDWVAMDIEYVEKMSFRLDLSLLAKTIPAVLSGRGAY